MKISEIFYSIQGEGKWTGLPNIFIRTTGCNLRCSYCDTKYAYEGGTEKTMEKIMNEVKKYNCKKICLTGGEPLYQKETIQLIDKLLKIGYEICLETNGSLDITPLTSKKNLIISLDIKCPSSKMHKKMIFENIKKLKQKDQLKLVIKDKNDYEYTKKIINKYKPACDVFFQPVWDTNPKHLADWIIKDDLDVKLGLQIHKIIWENKRGN
jgi:7-carboxy-7-deazaguanine synthase